MPDLVIGIILGLLVSTSATHAASLHIYPIWQTATSEYKIGYIDGLSDGFARSLDSPGNTSIWLEEIRACTTVKSGDQLVEIADHAVALGPNIAWTEGHKRDRVLAALALCGQANGAR
jgi:hypothetical protein